MSDPAPFHTAAEAWFWFCLMQVERNLGHKSSGSGPGRPCDIDDVALLFTRACREGRIGKMESEVMLRYGVDQRIPDRRVDPRGLQQWESGLDRLHSMLTEKGIVAIPETIARD